MIKIRALLNGMWVEKDFHGAQDELAQKLAKCGYKISIPPGATGPIAEIFMQLDTKREAEVSA